MNVKPRPRARTRERLLAQPHLFDPSALAGETSAGTTETGSATTMTTGPTTEPAEAPRKPSNQHAHAACGATWTGSRACHCSGCHRTFSGLTLFDRHRDQRGEYGRCLDPAEFGDVEQRGDGVWAYPEMSAEAKSKIYGRAS